MLSFFNLRYLKILSKICHVNFIFWKRRRVCNHIGYIFKFKNDLVTHKNYNHIYIWNKFKLELGDIIVLLTRVLSHIIKSQLNMNRSKIITWEFHTNLKNKLFKILEGQSRSSSIDLFRAWKYSNFLLRDDILYCLSLW